MRVYFTSPWIPAEWIKAHGHEPHGIWPAETFPRCWLSLTAGVCAFAEMAARFAETQPDGAVIFTTACDQLRRGFDTATFPGQALAFLFNLPATQTPVAQQIYRSELARLGQFLLEMGGHVPAPDNLRHEMAQMGKARCRLRAAAPTSAARPYAEAVAQFHWNGTFIDPSPAKTDGKVSLAIVGGPFSAAHWPLLDMIEAAGGQVTLNATESGERSLFPGESGNGDIDNPFDLLATNCFNHIIDIFQRPNTRLYAWLKTSLETRHVKGIVLWHLTNCDLWRAEAQTLRETFGLPVLLLEGGAEPGVSPREANRIQAFVETLQ